MIPIDRKRVPPPKALTDPEGTAAEERRRALAFYQAARKKFEEDKAKPAPAGETKKKGRKPAYPNFDFDAYRSKEIKDALAALFHKKCAYCESRYVEVITGDVEHYRPKGRVATDRGKPTLWPGYYWLALEWENLLPSCALCNQKNKQVDLTNGETRTVGKLDWFPLVKEADRAKPEGDISKEDPLILNPCSDVPAEHLEFVERDGHRALLHARTPKGARTIEILGLNRFDLVAARREELAEMETLMIDLQRAFKRLARATTDADARDFQDEIREKRAKLEAFMNEEKEYSALARQEVPRFLKELEALTTPAPAPRK